MNGNIFFSNLSYSDSLPFVTLADDSKIKVQGLGQTHRLPNLSLNFVLYILGCPFNLIFVKKITHTLNCSVLFFDSFVYVQDRRTRRNIRTGSEYGGLYHLSTSVTCVSIASQSLTHQLWVTLALIKCVL